MANFGGTSVGCSNERESRGHLLGCDIIPYEINLWTTGKRRESNNSKFADSERDHNACAEAETERCPLAVYGSGFQLQASLRRHPVERRKGSR